MQAFLLKAGYVATLVTDASTTGSYETIGDPANAATAPTTIAVSATTTLGPNTIDRRYKILENGGNIAISIVFADLATDEASLALKAPLVSPTFTGTPILPVGFKIGSTTNTTTGAELNFVHGVTSAVQTQMDTKAPLASPAFTGSPTIAKANGTEASNAVTASGACGVITTSSLSTAAGATYTITWTNTSILSTSVILLSQMGGTNTKDISFSATAGSGTSTLKINNVDLLAALDGTVKLGYQVL